MLKKNLACPSFNYRFGLPADRLWVSVYKDDDEAFAIWSDEVSLKWIFLSIFSDLFFFKFFFEFSFAYEFLINTV